LRVAVKFGAPLDFALARAEAATCSKTRLKAIYQEVADHIMAAVGDCSPAPRSGCSRRSRILEGQIHCDQVTVCLATLDASAFSLEDSNEAPPQTD